MNLDAATFPCLPLFHAVETEPLVMDTRPRLARIQHLVLPQHFYVFFDFRGAIGFRRTIM